MCRVAVVPDGQHTRRPYYVQSSDAAIGVTVSSVDLNVPTVAAAEKSSDRINGREYLRVLLGNHNSLTHAATSASSTEFSHIISPSAVMLLSRLALSLSTPAFPSFLLLPFLFS